MKLDKEVLTEISYCARCGSHHEVEMKELSNSSDYSHWAMCPVKNQPILIKLVISDRPDNK